MSPRKRIPALGTSGATAATAFIAAVLVATAVLAAWPGAWPGGRGLALNPQPEPPAPQIYLDTGHLSFDVQPANVNGRLLVPMRVIFEALGASLTWDGATQTVKCQKGSIRIVLTVGSRTAFVNGVAVTLDAAPANINGRVLVPLRFISEALGAAVYWDGPNWRVLIDSPPPAERTVTLPPVLGDIFRRSGLPPGEWSLGEDPDSGQPQTGLAGILDAFLVAEAGKKAGPPKTYIPDVPFNPPPTLVDYWKYVTLIGDQDGWGGQIKRAATHALSVLREMEHPYSPDFSYWWLQYATDNARDQYVAAHPTDDWTTWPDFTEQIIEGQSPYGYQGICTEAALPSNFDPLFKTQVKDQYDEFVKDANGHIVWEYRYDKMPKPDAADKTEAQLYTMTDWSEWISLASEGTDGMKWYLRRFGPLNALGPLSWVNGNWQTVDHCVTVLGYNDTGTTTWTVAGQTTTYTGYFRCLDSRGDGFNGTGFFNIPYEVADTQFRCFRYAITKPFDSSATPYAYTARIRVWSSVRRSNLQIKIGVEGATPGSGGHAPVVVWNTPNQDPTNCPDSSHQVVIDVPLPADYAAQHWPPSASNHWFVWVECIQNFETEPNAYAEVRDFQVARLKKNANCLSVNKYETEVFTADPALLPVHVKESWSKDYPEIVYIKPPTQGAMYAYLPPANYQFTLIDPGDGPFTPGQPLTLNGQIGQTVTKRGPSGAPYTAWEGLANAEIRLYEADLEGCVNLPAEWKLLEGLTTGADGAFTFSPAPSKGWHCYAAAYMHDGEVEQSTQYILVYVGAPPGQGIRTTEPLLPVDLR